MLQIINYDKRFEDGWLRCRVLAYLYTSMYEDVVTRKPHFDRPSIELLAIENEEVIGILDMILDTQDNKTSFLAKGLGAFLQVIAVHPDHQSKGIGKMLMDEAMKQLADTNIEFIELYTRDDEQANNFYKKFGFELMLETYDVFGLEKGIRNDVYIQGIENKALQVKEETGEKCDFVIVDGVYEVFSKEALNNIEVERVHPSRGYLKKIN